MEEQFSTPILFIVFNRPDTTERVLLQIKKQRPKFLYIAADGPRLNCKGDKDNIDKVKEIITKEIDWPCELRTLYRENNLCCKQAVSSAISWFFNNVNEGIILEDDCLPDQSFFRFAEELLKYYRNNPRIMQISGVNFQMGIERGGASYYFSIFNHIWGWATWRRAWKFFDLNMSRFEDLKKNKLIDKIFYSQAEKLYWRELMQEMYNGKINTWDYAWTFACWQNNGLTCLPNKNLVTNIGFNSEATHGIYHIKNVANVPLSPIDFPLIHPVEIIRDLVADKFTNRHHYRVGLVSFYFKKILNIFGLYNIIKKLAVKMRS